MMTEEQKLLINLLKESVNQVYDEERKLFDNLTNDDLEKKKFRKGLEQAFVFRVGIYFNNKLLYNNKFKKLDLDSEYNKNFGHPKDTSHFPKGIRPDLILHQRHSNSENKIAVEFKGWWSTSIENDIQKLKDLTNLDGKYKYLIGVFVHLGKEKNPKYIIVINNNVIECNASEEVPREDYNWSSWGKFPDPRNNEYLYAPFGCGVYQLRNAMTDELVLFGKSTHTAKRLTSLLPESWGAGTRNNVEKRNYVLDNIDNIEYRTVPFIGKEEMNACENDLKSRNEHLFNT